MRYRIVIISLLLSWCTGIAAIIPPEVKKCVAFIFAEDSSGKLQPQGTGFFVSVRSPNDSSKIFGYFVTAQHVIMDEKDSLYLARVFVRLNKRAGKSDTLLLNLFEKGKPVFFIHQDSTVDLAVIPALPDIKIYDYMFIPEELLATRELFAKENIQAGDDVFFTGMFPRHFGRSHNLPIVRFGKVALISDEKVLWGKVFTDLYLIETTSFGGNSGSPVFFNLDPSRQPGILVLGGPKLYLAGVIIGYFPVPTYPDWIEVKQRVVWAFENSGIATVVPATYLKDILNNPVLQAQRLTVK